MNPPGQAELLDALGVTWTPAATRRAGPFTLRDGAGGGKRVSAATLTAPFTASDLDAAEAAMVASGQAPLFMIRGEGQSSGGAPPDVALEAALEARGYALVDPVHMLVAQARELASRDVPFMACFSGDTPLAVMRAIWATGGIGPARLAVMERVNAPKRYFLGRHSDRPAGAAFAALHGRIAMLHALEVLEPLRGQSVAGNILGQAARWALDQGAEWLSVVTTGENLPARRLFLRAGMLNMGYYHYRQEQSGRTGDFGTVDEHA